MNKSKITCIWGSPSSGKTICALSLAAVLAQEKKNVIVFSTDKLVPALKLYCPEADIDSSRSIGSLLMSGRYDDAMFSQKLVTHPESEFIAFLGMAPSDTYITYANFERSNVVSVINKAAQLADHVIIEADGTKGLPLKVPNDQEPVIPAFADTVVAVAGLSALGRPLGEVCHRPELALLRFGFSPDRMVTPELMSVLLTSPLAQRKDVGARRYLILLNQMDQADETKLIELAHLLVQKGVERVVAAALQRHPNEYMVWKR